MKAWGSGLELGAHGAGFRAWGLCFRVYGQVGVPLRFPLMKQASVSLSNGIDSARDKKETSCFVRLLVVSSIGCGVVNDCWVLGSLG